jgi:hypothetical protein
MSRRGATVLALVWCLAVSGELSATTLVPADFSLMVSQSQVIVHGRVVDVRGELVGARRTIESVITVEVLTRLKGAAGEALVFRVPGGRVGRYRRIFVGAPVFAAGDEVVLFLKGRAPVIAMPFGLNQGVYRVLRSTGVPVVIPVPRTDTVAGSMRGDPVRRPLAFSEFARQIQATLEGGR